MGPTVLFDTIHRSYYIISANFYFYLQYFQQKIFSFNQINEFLTNPKESNSIHEVVYQRKRKRPKTHTKKVC